MKAWSRIKKAKGAPPWEYGAVVRFIEDGPHAAVDDARFMVINHHLGTYTIAVCIVPGEPWLPGDIAEKLNTIFELDR